MWVTEKLRVFPCCSAGFLFLLFRLFGSCSLSCLCVSLPLWRVTRRPYGNQHTHKPSYTPLSPHTTLPLISLHLLFLNFSISYTHNLIHTLNKNSHTLLPPLPPSLLPSLRP